MVNEQDVKEAAMRVLRIAANNGRADFSDNEQRVIADAILAALKAFEKMQQS